MGGVVWEGCVLARTREVVTARLTYIHISSGFLVLSYDVKYVWVHFLYTCSLAR